MSYTDYTNYKNNKNACICRVGLQGPTGEKGPRGATGATGSSGETIGYYAYTTSTMTNPTDLTSASTTNFGWNPNRASAQENYIAWNSTTQLSSTHIYISYIDQSGVDVRNFLTMLRANDHFIIQAKGDATAHQEWKISSINLHDAYIDFGVSNPTTQVNPSVINSNSVILIFSYSGVAFANLANGLEAKVAALEAKISVLETTINSILTRV
jgi:hypothetical protein